MSSDTADSSHAAVKRGSVEHQRALAKKARLIRIEQEFDDFKELGLSEQKKQFYEMKQRVAELESIPLYRAEADARLQGITMKALRPAEKLNMLRETKLETRAKLSEEAQQRFAQTTTDAWKIVSELCELAEEARARYADVVATTSDVLFFQRAKIDDPSLIAELEALQRDQQNMAQTREREIASELDRIEQERLDALEKQKEHSTENDNKDSTSVDVSAGVGVGDSRAHETPTAPSAPIPLPTTPVSEAANETKPSEAPHQVDVPSVASTAQTADPKSAVASDTQPTA